MKYKVKIETTDGEVIIDDVFETFTHYEAANTIGLPPIDDNHKYSSYKISDEHQIFLSKYNPKLWEEQAKALKESGQKNE